MSAQTWFGVSNIMITPFTATEEVDIDGVVAVTNWAIDAGVDSLVPLGIMGEAHKLTDIERDIVLGTVVDAAAGRVPVIAGCTAESTVAAISRVKRAEELGASAAMIAPARAATTPALQLAHYETIAAAIGVPIVVQDEPVTTGVKMLASTIGAMGTVAGIDVAKVEEVPSPTKVSGILAANPDLACFGGLGGLYMLEELNRGAVGIMTGFGYPEVLVKIFAEYSSGDIAAAQARFFHYLPLIRYEAQLGVGGVAIRKRLLVEQGIIANAAARQPASSGDPLAVGELKELISILDL